MKVGAFDAQTGALHDTWTLPNDAAALPLPDGWQVKTLAWASVAHTLSEGITRQFAAIEVRQMTTASPLPIENAYATPHTLGIDRLLAVIGARRLAAANTPILVLDAGTALTYDFATAEGVYLGGGISLGRAMRYRALHHFTAKLPDFSAEMPSSRPPLIGTTTQTAIRSGADNGLLAEVAGVVAEYQQRVAPAPLAVFITGGDAEYLATHLKSPTFAPCYVEPHLVLHGIHFALLYA